MEIETLHNTTESKRNFIVGSEWLYYKIYTGAKTSDAILTELIRPLAYDLLNKRTIDKWFFIRYADPNHHLRIRFKVKDPEAIGKVINELYNHLEFYHAQDLIWKIQIETYQKELERYGKTSIHLSEELFYIESELIVNFLNLIEGNEGEELRWMFALKAIDSLLDIFDYKLSKKLELMELLRIGFATEFAIDKTTKKQINNKYNQNRSKIVQFINPDNGTRETYDILYNLLDTYQKKGLHTGKKIISLKQNNLLEPKIENLISSHIHMLMNRIFRNKNRLHEMVCYDFLTQYYKMQTFLTKGVKKHEKTKTYK